MTETGDGTLLGLPESQSELDVSDFIFTSFLFFTASYT